MPFLNVVSFCPYYHKQQTSVNSRDTTFGVAQIRVHIFNVSKKIQMLRFYDNLGAINNTNILQFKYVPQIL